jgi:hypothetical protein
MKSYDREKLLRLAKQGKLVVLIPAAVGENIKEEDFEGGNAFESIDDQTITLVTGDGKRIVFASRNLIEGK